MKLTNKEATLINVLVDLLYAEPGFSDATASDLTRDSEFNHHQVGGLISSLEAKGIIQTVPGEHYGIDFDIIYLKNEEMHPVWAEESEVEYVNPFSLVAAS